MTADDFAGITANLASGVDSWRGAVKEAQTELGREYPNGVDVSLIGHRAWQKITPVQRARALDSLFHAYVIQLCEEERADQLGAASAAVTTYLEGDEEYRLHSALSQVRPIDDRTEVTVSALDLSAVLDELDLIRYRLTMAKNGGQS